MAVIESISRSIVHSAPYIPSCLSFREAAPLASLVDELRETGRPLPQVLLVDGNGRLHPRQVGSAVAVGLLTGIPTIGVAKEFHPYDLNEKGSETEGTPRIQHQFAHLASQKGMRDACRDHLRGRGDWMALPSLTSTETLGAALLASPARTSTRPIFVSAGHLISLESSIAITLLSATEARVPEPIRRADEHGREEAKRRWGTVAD